MSSHAIFGFMLYSDAGDLIDAFIEPMDGLIQYLTMVVSNIFLLVMLHCAVLCCYVLF